MPQKKEILILANSIKRGQYCVAGREVIREGGRSSLGNWVRPIGEHLEGALSYSDIRLQNGEIPQFLDVVEVALAEAAPSPTQPENWKICPEQWGKKERLEPSSFSMLKEEPQSLWFVPGRPDRISTDSFIKKRFNTSLYIIEPEDFCMKIWTEPNPFSGGNKKQRRAIFRYRNIKYDLAITDPDIGKKYFQPFPKLEEDTKTIYLNSSSCLLCVSLTPEFNGYHYKVVATVIEQ